MMGTEAVSPVQIPWLRVPGQQEFGAPSDPQTPAAVLWDTGQLGAAALQGQGDTQPSVSLKK